MGDWQALQSPIYSQVAGVRDACGTARDDHNTKLQEAVLSLFSGKQSDLQVQLQAFGEQAPVSLRRGMQAVGHEWQSYGRHDAEEHGEHFRPRRSEGLSLGFPVGQ